MQEVYDLAILGCGPAGLSAALNARIRNKKVIVIGNEVCSPPLHKAQKIDNYLGFPGIRGQELLERFDRHLLPFLGNQQFPSRFIQTEFQKRCKKSNRGIPCLI